MIKYGLSDFSEYAYHMRVTAYLLSFTHSAINPIIYGLMSTNFRKMLLQCCKDSVCCKISCSSCGEKNLAVIEEQPQRRTISDSYEFSTRRSRQKIMAVSTRRSRQANSVNVDDPKLRRNEQWIACLVY
ncbi:g_PROTEIN_RECEP_F1_2 domain-containing protein [Trichonephila clavipes]|nr:g_PROTEIN_RECEP_F1_2 domain-containing protein [Trichonephila clavipes]